MVYTEQQASVSVLVNKPMEYVPSKRSLSHGPAFKELRVLWCLQMKKTCAYSESYKNYALLSAL